MKHRKVRTGAKIISLGHDAKSYAPVAIEMVVVVDVSTVPVRRDNSTILILFGPDGKPLRLMDNDSLGSHGSE